METVNAHKLRTIYLLQTKNTWDQEFLGEAFKRETALMRPREFFVLEEKVRGTHNQQICRILGIKKHTLETYISDIRSILRHGFRKKVDDVELKGPLGKCRQCKKITNIVIFGYCQDCIDKNKEESDE